MLNPADPLPLLLPSFGGDWAGNAIPSNCPSNLVDCENRCVPKPVCAWLTRRPLSLDINNQPAVRYDAPVSASDPQADTEHFAQAFSEAYWEINGLRTVSPVDVLLPIAATLR